jgi:hypothetical protein
LCTIEIVDFIEERILGGFRPVPNGTGTFVGLASQDCAALVLGYFRFSLREKERGDELWEKERDDELREKVRADEVSSDGGSGSPVGDCYKNDGERAHRRIFPGLCGAASTDGEACCVGQPQSARASYRLTGT